MTDALSFIEVVCGKEEIAPTLHNRERGDIYALLAEVYLKENNTEEALNALKKMVDHDLSVRTKYESGMKLRTPMLCDTDNVYYDVWSDVKSTLLAKLANPAFDVLKGNADFSKLIEAVGKS